jgi:hypothetical protein
VIALALFSQKTGLVPIGVMWIFSATFTLQSKRAWRSVAIDLWIEA